MINTNAEAGARLLAADIATTLGYEVETSDRAPTLSADEADRPGGWISLRVPALDIEMGYGPSPTVTPDSVACQVASHIQDDVLSRTGMIWPAYPGHGDQPLVPGDTGWYSESDSAVLVPYGQVRSAHPPNPDLDGVVRWWLGYWFVGVIADESGDIWFSEHEFEGDLSAIRPGAPVEYVAGNRTHGKFRKAVRVRVTS